MMKSFQEEKHVPKKSLKELSLSYFIMSWLPKSTLHKSNNVMISFPSFSCLKVIHVEVAMLISHVVILTFFYPSLPCHNFTYAFHFLSRIHFCLICIPIHFMNKVIYLICLITLLSFHFPNKNGLIVRSFTLSYHNHFYYSHWMMEDSLRPPF